ncbi:hypothetical protein PsorP6_013263 [Peronosclerospora sorghi]|uniref:Uncharacterized protein n=1 Tax=Peronosclerospora sorghi TaxID=230839 RepID=A0ACC0WGP0_9STRA|nr:hypothetical protein PsorP6_013263 [Peronosclerospora sorghi]
MDASLTETEYDVLLIGTGMVEAIVAGALARSGKKVLHLDEVQCPSCHERDDPLAHLNEFYGSQEASFSFVHFRRWLARPRGSASTNNDNCTYDGATQRENLSARAFLNASQPYALVPLDQSCACTLVEETFASDTVQAELEARSSSFNIDLTPRCLLASEALVDDLITSGVGRYLEFTALERTYVTWEQDPCVQASNPTTPSSSSTVWPVPCSKNAVFQSTLLTRVEKRQLMKFLQFVADYGETNVRQQAVATRNERTLAPGRALVRPQNKSVPQVEAATYRTLTFQELLHTHLPTSEKLRDVIVYCLASFARRPTTSTSAHDGLKAVYRYLASLGRFTSTSAWLVPRYGLSEVAQSFCRLSAVYGGLYVLRAPIHALVVTQNTAPTVVGVQCRDGAVLRATHVVVNGSYGACLRVGETHVQEQMLLRGVFVLTRSLQDATRLLVMVPPHEADGANPCAVHIVQLDASACVVPPNYFLVHMSMLLPPAWVHDAARQKMLLLRLLRRLLVNADPTLKEHDAWRDVIAWRVLFTMKYVVPGTSYKSNPRARNLWVVGETHDDEEEDQRPRGWEIHLESIRAAAYALFQTLCPQEPFLPKSASAAQAEEDEDEDQEEQSVLEAAQKLVQQQLA